MKTTASTSKPDQAALTIVSAEFVTSAVKPDQYPLASMPEVAFAGRSNVGKSSLINTLVNRKRLVKTSNTPGRTQLINFFDINAKFRFVDLPGYGFARVPEAVRKTWGPMIETYLTGRPTLQGVVLLLDIRRKADMKDMDLVRWLRHYGLKTIYVLTKADKLSRSRQDLQRQAITRDLEIGEGELVVFSSKTRQGKGDLWQALLLLLEAASVTGDLP